MEETTTLSVTIPVEHHQKLSRIAEHLGVSAEDLVRTSIETLIAQPPQDFAEAVDYVLKKNAELYRRLA
jgi:predicted DNA-binding protein